jgi:ribose transport system permease protein
MKKELGIFILLVVLCAFVGIMNPQFLSTTNLQNQSVLIGIYGIFSIGVAFTIITGGIDLSIGSLFALQGVVLSILLRDWGWPWPLAAGGTILGMMAIGLFHGVLVARVRMQAFIVTLCGLLFYRGLARYITNDATKGFGLERYGVLRTMYDGRVFGVPMPFVLLIVIAVVMWLVLQRSVYGRYLYAVGRNEEAARYSGIPTRLIVGSAYVVSAGLAGISGILLCFYSNSIGPANHGSFYELYGIAAAVLGGCSLRGGEGTIIGILIGTALLQVLQNLVNMLDIPSQLNFAVMGAVILIGVLADQVMSERRKRRLAVAAQEAAKGA